MSNNLVTYDFKPNVDNGYYLLGENVLKNDLLQADSIVGKAYKISYLDYAVCGNITYGTAQTTFDTGKLITDTSLGAQSYANNEFVRGGLLKHSSGDIFVSSRYSNAAGLKVSKFNKSGDLLGVINIDTGVSANNNNHLLELSNGNILSFQTESNLTFAIFDSELNVVKTLTVIDPAVNSVASACALSGGGFAAVYQYQTNPLMSRLVVYDNAGNITTASTTIWTRGGTTGDQYHRIAQLSNGNLVIAAHSMNTGSNFGLYYGIFTTSAGAVVSMTSIKATSSPAASPNLSVSSSGYFCISKGFTSDGLYAYVYNNSGVLQGSAFYSNTTAGISSAKKAKILTDNTDFYLLWSDSNGSKFCLTKIPTTGTNYLTTNVTLSSSNYDYFVDAFIENSAICYVCSPGSGSAAPQLGVIKLSNRKLISILGTTVGATDAGLGSSMTIIPLGERSFALQYAALTTTNTTKFVAGKYAQTAILGVSKSSKNSGDYADINMMQGAYKINLISSNNSSLSKAFNHNAYNFIGNKGSVNGYTAFLQGYAV